MILRSVLKKALTIFSVALLIVIYLSARDTEQVETPDVFDGILPHDAIGFIVAGEPHSTASGIRTSLGDDEEHFHDVFLHWDRNSQLQLICDDEVSLILDGTTLHNGDLFSAPALDYIDGEIVIPRHESDKGQFRFISTDGIPSVHLITYSESKDYLTDEKGNTAIGRCTVMDEAGKQNFAGDCSLKVHGNTSWYNDKKSYQFNLDYASNILGMTSQRKWILLARDEEYMTDAVMYQLARKTGDDYAPDFRYVNMFLNGQYEGMYLLIQKISIEGGTIKDVYDLETANNLLSDSMVSQHVSGGYMGEVLGFRGWIEGEEQLRIQTPRRWIRVRSPNNLTEEQSSYLSELVNSAEKTLYLPDGEKTKDGLIWSDYFDIESWVRQFLLQEISANMDTDLCSQYFYVKENERLIYGGPAWDFDRSFTYFLDNERLNYLVRLIHNASIDDSVNEYGILWLRQFDTHQVFHEEMKKFFFEIAEPKLLEILDDEVHEWQSQVVDSIVADSIRWNRDSASYGRQDMILQAFKDRLSYLHDYYSHEDDYFLVTFLLPGTRNSVVVPVLKGNTIGESVLPIFHDSADWYYEDEPFTTETIVDRDMMLTLNMSQEDETE